ncbi:YicC family protein [Chryseobacterium sp. A301]
MILSMTGFGRAEGIFEGKKVTVEIKSLNSKGMDLSMRVPMRYKEKEFEIRKVLNDQIVRGKVDCYINSETLEDHQEVRLSKSLLEAYMQELKNVASDGPDFEYLKMAIRMPEVISSKSDVLTEEEWEFLKKVLQEAMSTFQAFRAEEGRILGEELKSNLLFIKQYLGEVEPFESVRMDAVKQRYETTLKEFEAVDQTRFYQELAYYTEKLDIAEEKVRLTQHLIYYQEVLETENQNGKKLGFIAQEMGREINTLGSKANHAEIQKLVVKMKDHLEKIKEQTLNVL